MSGGGTVRGEGGGAGEEPAAAIEPEVWRRVTGVMERLAASSDLEEVLGLIIDAMRDCLGAERASVFEYDRARQELVASRAHGVERSMRIPADAGLAGEAVRTRRIINVPDCYADARFNPEVDRRTGFRTRCLLTVPLVSFDGVVEGVAQVLNRQAGAGTGPSGRGGAGGGFGATDEVVARALASQAAVAIRRARLLEAERRKNKMEADLLVAAELQRASLPRRLPAVAGYDMAAANRQAEETGGDAYDLMDLGDGRGVMIVMADASGHGVGPALSVAQAMAMVRMGARLGAPLERLIVDLNALLVEALPVGRFVTAFVGLLDTASHGVRYVSAGQAPVVVVRAAGGFEERGAGVPPLGVDRGMTEPTVEEIRLAPGDALLLLSDGYYEQADARGRTLSVAQVVEAAASAVAGPGENRAEEILAGIDRAVATLGGGATAGDDQTAVVVYRQG